MTKMILRAALASLLLAAVPAHEDSDKEPCVKRTGRAVKPGVNYCEEASGSEAAKPGPTGSISPSEASDREPTTHEICVANQSHYPDLVKDGQPLTAYQVCLWAWHSRDPALIWCLERWEEDHQLKRYGTMEECMIEAREHQRAEEASYRDAQNEAMAERWDAYYKQQKLNQSKRDIVNREHEKRRQFFKALGEGLKQPPQINCTTTRYGNTAQTICQ